MLVGYVPYRLGEHAVVAAAYVSGQPRRRSSNSFSGRPSTRVSVATVVADGEDAPSWNASYPAALTGAAAAFTAVLTLAAALTGVLAQLHT